MALGFKIKGVKTKGKYSLEELFAKIKDVEFTAGKPEWTKNGMAYVITFPALDRNNQVWILPGGLGKATNKFNVQKQQAAGVGNAAKNAALGVLTDGLSDLNWSVGGHSKRCEELVDITAQELGDLGL